MKETRRSQGSSTNSFFFLLYDSPMQCNAMQWGSIPKGGLYKSAGPHENCLSVNGMINVWKCWIALSKYQRSPRKL